MPLESRTFQLAKDPEHPDENEDAYRIDAARGMAAIADGAASGIFSRRWARLLADAVVADRPDPDDRPAFARWLAARRQAWQDRIDVSSLAWFQKPKLREGAFSTLLWIRLLEEEDGADPSDATAWRLDGFAVGDSCLFYVPDGQLLRTFPIEKAEQFEADPVVIGSVDLGRDELLEFESLDLACRDGDLLVLCTDAVAAWALKGEESGNPCDWRRYWDMTEEAWQQEVGELRTRREMRYDDATLVLLRVCREDSREAEEPAAASPASEPSPGAGETAPPPLPEAAAEDDWRATFRKASEQLADEVANRVAQGVKKLKQVRESAESAARKYRDKLHDNE